MARAARTAPKPAPKPSKDELLAQVEKLERTVLRLRNRNKSLTQAAAAAKERIEELEAEIARRASPAASRPSAPRSPAPGPRRQRERDPGDAVPPGVAVETNAPLDAEEEAVKERLEQLPDK